MIRTDTNAKGRFVWHSAGLDGQGGSSYIDSVILRDKDANTAWTTAADGTLEERLYYAQNWRADVSLVLSSTGQLKERIKYSAYGVPYCISLADYNGDGAVTQADLDTFTADNNADDLRSDFNFDGSADFFDYLDFVSEYNGGTGEAGGGRSSLSRASIGNRLGYAGYQWDPSIRGSITGVGGASAGKYHVRHRVLDAGQGRWTRRDPLGYVDGASVYEYVRSAPIRGVDPLGLMSNIYFTLIPDDNLAPIEPGPPVPPRAVCTDSRRRPGTTPKSNGCGAENGIKVPGNWGPFDFTSCCDQHDLDYADCRTDRSVADSRFHQCMLDECRGVPGPGDVICRSLAGYYYTAVSWFGGSAYTRAQSSYCICCDGPKQDPLCIAQE